MSLEQLFSLLPRETGMAFVVIQHLSPEFPSLMDELLGRVTKMTVAMAVDGVELEPDHVYLLPPAKQMIVHAGRLVLTERVAHTFTLPIDTFFRALAHDAGERAVAVVLSGLAPMARAASSTSSRRAASSSSRPLRPRRSTACPGRKRDRRRRSRADAARDREGARDARDARSVATRTIVEASPTSAILELLEQRYGIDFSLYKMTTVTRRIQRRIALARSRLSQSTSSGSVQSATSSTRSITTFSSA